MTTATTTNSRGRTRYELLYFQSFFPTFFRHDAPHLQKGKVKPSKKKLRPSYTDLVAGVDSGNESEKVKRTGTRGARGRSGNKDKEEKKNKVRVEFIFFLPKTGRKHDLLASFFQPTHPGVAKAGKYRQHFQNISDDSEDSEPEIMHKKMSIEISSDEGEVPKRRKNRTEELNFKVNLYIHFPCYLIPTTRLQLSHSCPTYSLPSFLTSLE